MKSKTYYRWVGRRVRRKSEPEGPIGVVVDSTKTRNWWLVEWPGGKKTQEPQRNLVIVEGAE